MDWCFSFEVFAFLLTCALQIVFGFSIRGHPRNKQDNQLGGWQTDAKDTREIADTIQFWNFPQRSGVKRDELQEPMYAQDDSSYLFNAFSSLSARENNDKRSLTPSSAGNDVIKYEDSASDSGDSGNINRDDDIDLFATISYPNNAIKDLDNLAMSKIGVLTVPSKRQQGWYVQYGKRTMPQDFNKNALDGSNSINYDIIEPQPATSKDRILADNSNEKSPKLKLNLELMRGLKKLESDLKINNIAYDIVKSIIDEKSHALLQPHSPVKRQQGWFTQYGKRSREEAPNSYS